MSQYLAGCECFSKKICLSFRSQQQLLDTTMSSSTSKTSIKETPKPTAIEEVPETKEEITVANGESEG